MSAGESAYDVARRQREKAARLERSAAKWEQGAEGEVEVARALSALPPAWRVLHDLAWPGRARANLDHVVVGPGGIFVIDAKNWSGAVVVTDHLLRQNGRVRKQTVESAAEAAAVFRDILQGSGPCVGVLCFVRDEPLTGWARDVMVCTTSNVVDMLTSRPAVLDAQAVDRCAEAIVHHTTSRKRVAAATPSSRITATMLTEPLLRRAAAPRRGRSTPWLKVAAGLIFLALLLGGGLVQVSQWASERMVEMVTPPQPVEPAPTTKAKRDKKNMKKKRDRAAQDASEGQN